MNAGAGRFDRFEELNIRVYRSTPTDYKDGQSAEEMTYMDHPYNVTRTDTRGTVSRACFRYLGDAGAFALEACGREVNLCLWAVTNIETGRLCCRWRYTNGRVEQEV